MNDDDRRVWEMYDGVGLINTGAKKRNGKPHYALVAQVLLVFSKADVKALSKKFPGRKFIERRRDGKVLPAEARKKARRCSTKVKP